MKNKGMYRLLSGVLCTSVLLSSQAYAAASADYSDFPQNWSKDAMEFAVKNNFITGVGEDKIAPKAALTRAQLAAILSRVMQTGAGDVSALDNFTDADKNAWYAGSMAKAVELNILYGDGDSIYPDRPVTRQELFTILVRAFSVTGGDESTLASYNDAGSISSWAKAAISAMIAQGYAAGYEDKTLRPAQQVTREEFAQLLHRMREHYSSSDTSEDKTETKTDDTAKTDETTKTNTKKPSGGGGGSSSGGSSSSGGGSHSSGGSVTVKKIVDETQATVQTTDMGAWLPLVFADGYDMSKATVTVDGTNATAAMTPVTTDGTIAKLALTGTPKQVVITATDGKTQTITPNGSGTAAVYTGTGKYLPDYVLAHGAVATWDYHLTNYDKEGNPRVQPAKTTFDTKDEVNTHPYYAPDAVIAEDDAAENGYKVSGTVTIMFNYNTEAERAWFDGIGDTVTLVANDGRYDSLGTLKMTKEAGVAHGRGKVGVLSIPVGQTNFYSNGRYYVRVQSTGGDRATTLVPIHLVNDVAPVFQTMESATSGVNLHFNVQNMTYGITNPIERVTLTDPTGTTKTLRKIDDYYLISQDLFVLYNDEKNGVNNIPYDGKYTMTVYSNGFKTVSKPFFVTGGIDAPVKQAFAVYQSAARDVDAVTHATGGSSGGGSSSDGSGGYMVSANLLFKSDLLVNALVLDKLGKATAASDKVVEDWYNMSGYDSLLNKGEVETYYKWVGYQDAINTTKLNKNDGAAWLPFAEYAKDASAETTPNRPYAVKEVLEDGLLGDIQHSNTYGRLEAPKATVGETKENQDVEITFENADAYMGKITKLYLNDNWQELSADAYTIEGNKITIKADALKIGENKITVDATGYLSNVVTIDYAKETEKELSLSVATPISEGQDVVITVTNSEGDFLKNLSGVVLKNSDGTEKTVYHQGYEGSNAVYYVVSEDGKTITLKNVEPGTYTVSVSANYYEALTTEGFTVERTTPLKTAPSVAKHEKKDKDGLLESTDYYRLTFSGLEGKDLDTYLGAIKKVTVGTKAYTEATSIYFQNDNYRTKIADSTYGGYKDALDLAVNGIDAEKGTLITVEAKGYKTMTYTLKGDSATTDPTPNPDEGKLNAPTYTITEKTEYGAMGNYPYYKVTFTGNNTSEYVKNITSVMVQETEYSPASGTEVGEKSTSYVKETGFEDDLKLGTGSFVANGKTTVTIKATGYKDLVIAYGTDATAPTEPTTKPAPAYTIQSATGTGAYGSYNYYEVAFDGDAAASYVKAITGVTVATANGTETYTKSSTDYAEGKTYVLGGIMASKVLKLGEGGFDKNGKTTITIKATDYQDLVIIYGNDSSDSGETEGVEAPTVGKIEKPMFSNYYRLTFDNNTSSSDIEKYLNAIKEVTVNGETYEAVSNAFSLNGSKYIISKNDSAVPAYIDFAGDSFPSGEVTVIIKAKGYKDLTHTFTK